MAQRLKIKYKKSQNDVKGVKVRNVSQNQNNSQQKKKKVRVKVVSKGTRKRR